MLYDLEKGVCSFDSYRFCFHAFVTSLDVMARRPFLCMHL